jgi:hypothetical protein
MGKINEKVEKWGEYGDIKRKKQEKLFREKRS